MASTLLSIQRRIRSVREEVAAERMSVAERKADPASWIIAIVSGLALCGLFVLGRGGLLRIGIPAAATCIALSVYFRKPSAYLEFALWTWLLTPFIRRVVDWRVGFADPNLTLLHPFWFHLLRSSICVSASWLRMYASLRLFFAQSALLMAFWWEWLYIPRLK